jgi:hypothetical protein
MRCKDLLFGPSAGDLVLPHTVKIREIAGIPLESHLVDCALHQVLGVPDLRGVIHVKGDRDVAGHQPVISGEVVGHAIQAGELLHFQYLDVLAIVGVW